VSTLVKIDFEGGGKERVQYEIKKALFVSAASGLLK